VDTAGHHLGTHEGIHQFTVGQRRGLQVALGSRAWVVSIDAGSARVVVAREEEELMSSGLHASSVVWGAAYQDFREGACEVQVRSRHRPVGARMERLPDGRVRVDFSGPQRAVTPGQAAVLYDGEAVMACGWIDESFKKGGVHADR
jgi:tRNA-specific 2-thiouridylase